MVKKNFIAAFAALSLSVTSISSAFTANAADDEYLEFSMTNITYDAKEDIQWFDIFVTNPYGDNLEEDGIYAVQCAVYYQSQYFDIVNDCTESCYGNISQNILSVERLRNDDSYNVPEGYDMALTVALVSPDVLTPTIADEGDLVFYFGVKVKDNTPDGVYEMKFDTQKTKAINFEGLFKDSRVPLKLNNGTINIKRQAPPTTTTTTTTTKLTTTTTKPVTTTKLTTTTTKPVTTTSSTKRVTTTTKSVTTTTTTTTKKPVTTTTKPATTTTKPVTTTTKPATTTTKPVTTTTKPVTTTTKLITTTTKPVTTATNPVTTTTKPVTTTTKLITTTTKPVTTATNPVTTTTKPATTTTKPVTTTTKPVTTTTKPVTTTTKPVTTTTKPVTTTTKPVTTTTKPVTTTTKPVTTTTKPVTTTTKPVTTTTKPVTTTTVTTTTPPLKATLYGDANCDNVVNISDVVSIKCYLLNAEKYSLSGQGIVNADVQNKGNGINLNDGIAIQQFSLRLLKDLASL